MYKCTKQSKINMVKIPGPNDSVNGRLSPLYGDCIGDVAAGVHLVAAGLVTDSSTLSHSQAPPAAPAVPSVPSVLLVPLLPPPPLPLPFRPVKET